MPAPAPTSVSATRRRSRRPLMALVLLGVCGGVALAPLALAPRPAGAQSLRNSLITTTLTQHFEADTNYNLDDPSDGTSYFADTRLAIGLLHETPDQAFTLGFDTGLRAFWEADEDFDLTFASPTTASAGYTREWAGTEFDTGFRYRQVRVDFDRPLDDLLLEDVDVELLPDGTEVLPDDIEQLQGETIEQRYDANVTLALATDAPNSYEFAFAGTRYEYSDDGSTRTPRSTIRGTALWTLRLTPVFSSAVQARYYLFEADNAAETQIRENELDAGVIYNASEALRLTAGLGYIDRTQEQTRASGEVVKVEDGTGPAIRAGLRYARNFLVLNADARLSDVVPDQRLSGNLRLAYPIRPDTRLNARAFRRYIGNSQGEEVQLTGAGVGLERDLNTVSRIGVDFAIANQVNEDDLDDPDIRRLDASATYSYDLTEQVSADLGYRFRNRDKDPENAVSHAVFFEIGRTFETLF